MCPSYIKNPSLVTWEEDGSWHLCTFGAQDLCEQSGSCPCKPWWELQAAWSSSPVAAWCHLWPLKSQSSTRIKARKMKISSENKTFFYPCFFLLGKNYVTNRTYQVFIIMYKLYILYLYCKLYVILYSIRKMYTLKHIIAFSAPCLFLPFYCLSALSSLVSPASPMAKWNPARHSAQTLSACSTFLLQPSALSTEMTFVGKLVVVTGKGATLLHCCLKSLCSVNSKGTACFGLPMICSGKVWLTQTLIFLWLYDFIHHLHCMKHLEVCIFKCNTPHGCRVDFFRGREAQFHTQLFLCTSCPPK